MSQPYEALLLLERYLNRKPEAADALKLYSALLETAARDKPAAEVALRRAAAAAPRDPDVWKRLGRLHLDRMESADAISAFRRGLEADPADPMLLAGIGYALAQSGKSIEEVRPWLARAEKAAAPGDGSVALMIAEALAGASLYKEALPWYERAVTDRRFRLEALLRRAIARERMGDLEAALADALPVVEASPNSREVRVLAARLYQALGREAEAEKHSAEIQRILREDEQQKELGRTLRAHLREGEPLIKAGRCAEAIPHYEAIVGKLPTFYEAWFALGACYGQTGRPAQAESALRRYLEYQTHSPDGHAALAVVLLDSGRAHDAAAAFRKAVELEPGREDAAIGLARAERAAGRPAAAREALTAALRERPGSLVLAEAWVSEHLACKQDQGCRAALLAAWKANPKTFAYWNGVARLFIEDQPQNELARPLLERMVREFPAEPRAPLLLAELLVQRNEFAEALPPAKKSAEMSGPGPTAVAALTVAATSAMHAGDPASTDALFRQALEMNRAADVRSADPVLRYAVFLRKNERAAEARRYLDELVGWQPGSATARLERAVCLAEAGDHAAAIADGLESLRLAGDSAPLQRAAHVFLARAYYAAGDGSAAAKHEAWVEKHAPAR